MEAPIHAAKEVDKGETVPKVIAAIAGLVIIAVGALLVAYLGIWSPPPTDKAPAPAQTTQAN